METILPALDRQGKEYRRFLALQMHGQGLKQAQIAKALGVSEGAVSQWFKAVKEQGVEALKSHPAPGQTPLLSVEQKQQLAAMLEQNAEVFGFRGNFWSRGRVQKLIEEEFGVHYHVSHMSRLLKQLGFSRQKPQKRARQQDPEAVAEWQQVRWPALKKSAGKKPEPPSS